MAAQIQAGLEVQRFPFRSPLTTTGAVRPIPLYDGFGASPESSHESGILQRSKDSFADGIGVVLKALPANCANLRLRRPGSAKWERVYVQRAESAEQLRTKPASIVPRANPCRVSSSARKRHRRSSVISIDAIPS